MKVKENHIISDEGKTIIRTLTGELMGKSLYLGYYYPNGIQGERVLDVPENFSEIEDSIANIYSLTFGAENSADVVYNIEHQWEDLTDDEKLYAVNLFPIYSYDTMVTMLIRKIYDEDRMEALINNYLQDAEKYTTEWLIMQNWRANAKKMAKIFIEFKNNNN